MNRRVPLAPDWSKLNDLIDAEAYRRALMLIIATKVNYFVMNHHTGKSMVAAAGYAEKVRRVVFEGQNLPEADTVKVMHMLGHWCSTRKFFEMVKPGTPSRIAPVTSVIGGKFTISLDGMIRLTGVPAGWAKTGLAYAIAKRFVLSPTAKFFNDTHGLKVLSDTYKKIIADPFLYHMGASYLLGRPIERAEDNGCGILGRMITWLRYAVPNSSLMKSPHVAQNNISKERDYEDYNEPWDRLCQYIYKKRDNKYSEDTILEISRVINEDSTVTVQSIADLRNQFHPRSEDRDVTDQPPAQVARTEESTNMAPRKTTTAGRTSDPVASTSKEPPAANIPEPVDVLCTAMTQRLPMINGIPEVGIAAGSDQSIEDHLMLHVDIEHAPAHGDKTACNKFALACAIHFMETSNYSAPPFLYKIVINGIIAALSHGLIAYSTIARDVIPDGDIQTSCSLILSSFEDL